MQEIKRSTKFLTKEAQKLYYAIEQHNIQLAYLDKETEKIEKKSLTLSNKLLKTVKELKKDSRNSLIIFLTVSFLLLLLYIL